MATSMLLRTADQGTPQETNITLEPIKTRGRKSSRTPPSQKKQPQRGLGVAQLERLRLQERWKKMEEISQSQPQYYQPRTLSNHFHYQTPFTENPPLGSVPVRYDLPNYYGGAGPHAGTLMVIDPYPFVAGPDPDPRLQIRCSREFENSEELSSMPKLHCVSDRCEFCFKKLFPLSNVGIEAVREKNTEIPLANILDRKGAEVKQIHRKGNTTGGNIFTEYEFFPGKSGGTGFKELEFAADGSFAVVGGGSEACCITNTTYNGGTSSNAVDLSLKLSF